MTTFNDPLGVLSGGEFSLDDGFEVIMKGEESRRSPELPRYASTQAEIRFQTEVDLETFVDIMEETDRRLALVTDFEIVSDHGPAYDWQKVLRKGLTIRFGVMWYSKDYFEQKKDAYKSEAHAKILEKFNVTADDIIIKHTIL